MKRDPRKFSAATFGFALLCFLLPFVTVSCTGGQMSLSGLQLMAGTEIEGQRVSGEPLAGLAFLATLVGLGASFLKSKEGMIGGAISGGAGALALLILQSKLTQDVLREGGGLAVVHYEAGYWLTVLTLGCGLVLNLYGLSVMGEQSSSQDSSENIVDVGEASGAKPRT